MVATEEAKRKRRVHTELRAYNAGSANSNLFHPEAEGVFCFDDAANKPTKLLHDCRRSAVRNMVLDTVLDTVRGGTSEKVCMAISGHKTRSIYDRYDIVSEKDLMAAAKRLSDHVNKAAEKLSRERQSH